MNEILGLYNYWIVIFLMMTGFYIVISRGNLVKKVIGLNIFQTSVFLMYITIGKVQGGTAPILAEGIKQYSNWPTIPQLYVNGEFIGGSDIMVEMYQKGELQSKLSDTGG